MSNLYELFVGAIGDLENEMVSYEKKKLFGEMVKSMDNYVIAVESEDNDVATYYEARSKTLHNEINRRGLLKEFEEFALVI